MNYAEKTDFDVIIVGAGPVGLTAALALADAGCKTALVDVREFGHGGDDPRASTLAASSLEMMRKLGLEAALSPHLQPINDMMIGEGRPGKISPLTLHFDGERRGSPMASMIENSELTKALEKAVSGRENITLWLGDAMSEFKARIAKAGITLSSGETLTASLVIAADGRNSALRRAAGIAVEARAYDQSAIVTTVAHDGDHKGVAYQMFFPGGPFAILPLTGGRSSLVWSDSKHAVAAAMALPDDAFLSELSRRFGDHLGALKITGPKLSYPLNLQMAECYTHDRLALIGDAAHVVHPIAGQGLNMGLRDVAALTEVVSTAKSAGLDIGGAELEGYAQWRRSDNRTLGLVTDQLNGLFSNRIAPLRHLRRLGLAAVDRSDRARDFFMAEAAGELGDLPPLLRA